MSLIGSMPRTASKFLLVEIRVVRRVRAGTELVVMKFLLMTGDGGRQCLVTGEV